MRRRGSRVGGWMVGVALTLAPLGLLYGYGGREAGPAEGPLEGRWSVTIKPRWIQLGLRLDGSRHHRTSFSVDRDELSGTGADGIPGFALVRDAGTFDFRGRLGDGEGGTFEFRGDPAYAGRMQAIGFDVVATPKRLFELAVIDVAVAFAEGIRDVGYGDVGVERLVEFRIHGVSPEFVTELAAAGYRELPPQRLVEFRIHGVSPEFVTELAAAGYRELPPNRLVEFRIHGVSPEFVAELAAAGYRELPPNRLVEFRIHGVSPEFVRDMQAVGLDDLSASRLVEMRIHGVTREFARAARDRYGDVSARELVEMRIHGKSVAVR